MSAARPAPTRTDGAQTPSLKPCVSHDVLARLGDKWTTSVVWLLAEAPGRRLRFSVIRNGIDGITQRMLTVTLRGLERDGFVARHFFPEVPPRVEYELTDLGSGMFRALEGFADWLGRSWPRIEDARKDFDAALGPRSVSVGSQGRGKPAPIAAVSPRRSREPAAGSAVRGA